MTAQTPVPQPYDDGTPASPEQIEALWRQLREFSAEIEADRTRLRANEIARLTMLRDQEADEVVRAQIQTALDAVLEGDARGPVPSPE